MKRLYAFLLFILSVGAAAADFQIPFQQASATIDGKDDDVCWQNLTWNSDFVRNRTGEKADADTRFKIFHNNRAFYILAEAMEPKMGKLKTNSYTPDSGHHWQNDSLEINFVPDPTVMSFYKFIVDAAGEMDDMACVDDNTDRQIYAYNLSWDGNAVTKTARLADRWRLEMMIPIGGMDIDSATSTSWRFNLARNRYAGSKETTSWSNISRDQNVTPREFRKVSLEKFNIKNYLLEAPPVEVKFARKLDGSFEFSTKLNLINRTGSFKRVTVNYKLLHPETKKVCHSFFTDKELAKDYPTETADTFKGATPGNYIFETEILSSGRKPYLLKKLSRMIKLEYQPVKIRLVRPAYRRNIYASMPDKTIEAEIDLGELAGIPLKVELIGLDGFKESRTISKSAALNKVTFDGSKLADGRYSLQVSGQNGQEKVFSEVKIRKLPYQKGEVWLDTKGVTHIDGKPFLPYGFDGVPGKNGLSYTNWTYSTVRFGSVEAAQKTVGGYFKKTGLYYSVQPFSDMIPNNNWSNKIFASGTRKGRLTPEQRSNIMKLVPEFSKTEGILVWEMADEPEGKDHNPRWYEEALELLAELDPYHPTVMVNYGIWGMQKYYTGCDILLPDCYPCFWEDGSSEKPRTCSAEWVKAGTALRPTWFVPIATLWPGWSKEGKRGVPPDYHDQRQQIYQALIHNAKGFLLYNYPRGQYYSSCIIGPRVTGLNLQKMKEYALENSTPDAVAIKTAPACPDFQVGMKEHGSQFCIIANNTSLNEVKVDFSLKNRFSGELYPEGGKRAVTVQNGKFSDTFRGKETILYFTDRQLAVSLPEVDSTLKEIADLQKARKNPHNLLSRGEILIIYKDKQKRLSESDIPKISSSSDAKSYISDEIGSSLYFLIDGLTDVDLATYTWTPQKADQQPWVEFKLPEKHPLHKAILYTINGNLIDCDAVVNGKTYSVRNNKENKIIITLDGEISDTFRVNILRRKSDASGLAGCLLTEVELY